MKASFTGTVKGTTPEQRATLRELLVTLAVDELNHGASPVEACADWQADAIARELGIRVVHWPPANPSSAAMLARNKLVAEAGDVLFTCPGSFAVNPLRSGTWSTVRRAWDAKVAVIVIWPVGRWDALEDRR